MELHQTQSKLQYMFVPNFLILSLVRKHTRNWVKENKSEEKEFHELNDTIKNGIIDKVIAEMNTVIDKQKDQEKEIEKVIAEIFEEVRRVEDEIMETARHIPNDKENEVEYKEFQILVRDILQTNEEIFSDIQKRKTGHFHFNVTETPIQVVQEVDRRAWSAKREIRKEHKAEKKVEKDINKKDKKPADEKKEEHDIKDLKAKLDKILKSLEDMMHQILVAEQMNEQIDSAKDAKVLNYLTEKEFPDLEKVKHKLHERVVHVSLFWKHVEAWANALDKHYRGRA